MSESSLVNFARVGEFRLGVLVQKVADLPRHLWPDTGKTGRRNPSWRAYLVRTVTGELGPALDPVNGSWSIELNGVESGQVTLRKADLHRVESKWFTPWWGSVLLTYTHEGIERPIVAGPVTGWPTETRDELTLSFAGIRKALEKRSVIGEDPLNARKDIAYNGLSLGTIAWEVVRVAQNKPGGALPIVHGTPYETLSPGHERTYPWWNLANQGVDAVLTKLSEVIEGPDIMFRPEFTDDSKTAIRWSMVHGTEVSPVIAQKWVPDWDTTSARSNVVDVSVKSSADHLATRVWGTGAGEESGTVIRSVQDLAFVEAGGPFLETVFSDPDQEDPAKLIAKAQGVLQESGDMVDQVALTLRASDRKAPLGTWHVGDNAAVTLSGWLSVPDGTRHMRVISASGGLDDTVTVQTQTDSW